MRPGSYKTMQWWIVLGAMGIIGLNGYVFVAATQATTEPASPKAVLNQYATIVHASYEDTYTSAMAMRCPSSVRQKPLA